MATTARKRKEKEIKIEANQQEPVPAVKDTLESQHLLCLEVYSRDIEIAKTQMAVEEQNLNNLILSLELLKSKIDKQKSVVANKDLAHVNAVKKFENYKKEIWPLYGLKEDEGLGYDPISGEIKRS